MANIVTDLRPISSDIDHYNAAYGVWKQRSSHQKTSMNWIQSTLPSYVEQLAMLRNDQHIDILGVGSGAGMYIFFFFLINFHLSDRGTFTPVGAQGGRKSLSHRNFV